MERDFPHLVFFHAVFVLLVLGAHESNLALRLLPDVSSRVGIATGIVPAFLEVSGEFALAVDKCADTLVVSADVVQTRLIVARYRICILHQIVGPVTHSQHNDRV
jgi:hypothetical protein